VSASWLACTLTSIDGSQNGLPSLRYFGLSPTQPLRLALMDPTDRYLRAWKPVPSCPQFDQQRVLSRFFSLLLPLPMATFSTIMAKRKATAEELEARAESNGYKRGAHREKDSTRDNGKHNKKTKRNQHLMAKLTTGHFKSITASLQQAQRARIGTRDLYQLDQN
jgi:hypothetical protein